MRAPPNFLLALLTLSISGAYAAGPAAGDRPVAGLRDSSGQAVKSSFGECWGTGFTRPDAAACASLQQQAPAPPAIAGGGSAAPQAAASTSGETAAQAIGSSEASGAGATSAQTAIRADGNPAYVTDSNGFVVRGSQGECWRTGSWTPAQATVVGCDGVLAKALPVPAPAPSPKPPAAAEASAPPPEPAPPAAQATVPVPTQPGSSSPPAVIAPSGTPPASAAAAPKGGKPPPVVVPPSPPAPATAELGPQGADVGHPSSEKVTLDTDTYFDFDKSTLKPDGERKLRELAKRLSSMNLEVVVATGHTDWTGTDAYNQKLSERRASAVKQFLSRQGLPENRIFTEGKGEKQPVASNRSREGRAQNRRVEVELVGTRSR